MAPRLSISWSQLDGLRRFDNMLNALGGQKMRAASVSAINRTGDMAKTQVIRALPRQTGLKRKVIVKAIGRPKRATWSSLNYVITTQGGDISLKYFSARENRRGVSAKPFGERKLFAGAFMRAGLFPNRVSAPSLNGHVFERVGSKRLPLTKLDSGVVIPTEMVQGATADAFERSVTTNLPRRIEHEITRLSGGVLT